MRILFRVLASALLLPVALVAQTSNPASDKAAASDQSWRAIHNSAIIIDTHADTPGRFVDENFDLAQDAGTGYIDFNKIKAGNLGAEFFSIWVEPKAQQGSREPSARST